MLLWDILVQLNPQNAVHDNHQNILEIEVQNTKHETRTYFLVSDIQCTFSAKDLESIAFSLQ